MSDMPRKTKLNFKVAVAAILMLIVGRVGLAQTATDDDVPHVLPVSMVTLLAMPASSSAKQVQVSGFLVLDFEGQALYLHKEDYQEGLTLNSIYVVPPLWGNRSTAATSQYVPSGFRTKLQCSDAPSISSSIFHQPGWSSSSPPLTKRFVGKSPILNS
jgi:hypothetical protein